MKYMTVIGRLYDINHGSRIIGTYKTREQAERAAMREINRRAGDYWFKVYEV